MGGNARTPPGMSATKQRPGALADAGALRRPYAGTGSNIKTRTGRPQAGRPVRSHHNRNVAPPGPPPAARNPANQTPRAVPLHRRGPSLATAKGPVREVDAMADSGQNRRFTADESDESNVNWVLREGKRIPLRVSLV